MAATIAPAVAAPVAAPIAAAGPIQSSSLWVGELTPEVTEAELFDLFNNVGPVASVRVCRDAVTRRSLGYAYVNFQSAADAERALDTMNYEPIHNKSCRIMWCQRDPSARRSGVGNIFVKGLDESIDNKALYDAFSIFGNILSVKVVHDASGRSVGRGFVHFETENDATEAINKADGTLLKDKKINVAHFLSRSERLRKAGSAENQFKNVFVKNLPESVNSEEALSAIFKEFGHVGATTSVYLGPVVENPRAKEGPKENTRYGFVCFLNSEDAKKAVAELNGKEVEGKALFVGRAMKKSERANYLRHALEERRKERHAQSRGVNLYVKNLHESFDDSKLRDSFKEFGTITSARVMVDEKSISKCFGFVCFASQQEATSAITETNGRMYEGKPLYVALAQPREERRQQLAMQHRQRMQYQRQQQGFLPPQAGMFPPMFIGGPGPFGAQRPQQPYYGQRPAGAPQGGRYAAVGYPSFGGNLGGARQPRPNFGGARPGQTGRGGIPQGAPRTNQRYSTQARNVQQQLGLPAPAAIQDGSQQLATLLASSEPERQKQILGDHIYPLVHSRFPQVAGKLTGMLLQMDNSELLHLLEDPVTLEQELTKAYEVLISHSSAPQ